MKSLFVRTLILSLILISSGHAEFDRAKFQAYLKRMADEKKPATLIIGCGHKNQDHKHQDHWTVDIDNFDQFALSAGGKPEAFARWGNPSDSQHWKTIDADDCYDITAQSLPVRYKEQFDVVVLEHVNNVVSRTPSCLMNAYYMLKEGGKLYAEVRSGHAFNLYENIYHSLLDHACPDSDDENTDEKDPHFSQIECAYFDEDGIKGLEEYIKDSREIEPTAKDYLDLVKKFIKEFDVDKKNPNHNYLIRAMELMGFKNIISLLNRSTYQSPFSRERTPVIYAEKRKLSPSNFRKYRTTVSKHDYKPSSIKN